MKKIMLLAALALGGCTAAQQQTEAQVIAEIQQDAVLACSFLPTVNTVANILAAGVPGLSVASSVAQAICSSVTAATTAGALRANAAPTVAGVVIHGRFTN